MTAQQTQPSDQQHATPSAPPGAAKDATGSATVHDVDTADGSTAGASTPTRTERVVEQAARESFPASDPPSFTPVRAGGADVRPDDPPLGQDESREERRAWAQQLCRAFDASDAAAIADMLTEDVMTRIGMAPLLVGRDAARQWLAAYFGRVGSAIHHITDTRVDGDALVIESEVNVRTADGVKTMVPEAMSVRLRGGSASRLTVYGGPADLTPA